VNVRPSFLRNVSIFFTGGLLILVFLFFNPRIPHFNLAQPPRVNCPLLALLKPLSKAPVQPTDSLELVTFTRELVPYTVRVYGDGRVERDTTITLTSGSTSGCPLHNADKHLRIPTAQAVALISSARDGGFCRLCELYQPIHPAAYGHLAQLTLTFHGKTTRVANLSPHPPQLVTELVTSFSTLPPLPDYATTHHPTREREIECFHFMDSQVDSLKNRRTKR
jgi:hypothetical protein